MIGVKLPSNASKSRSGTRADFQRQADKMEAAAKAMLARHRANDALPVEPGLAEKDARQIERLDREAAQMRQWLSEHPEDRKGAKGKVIKSNRTDNQSAKMATSKGVIQGYTGVAAVDDKHQIIVDAQAHGTPCRIAAGAFRQFRQPRAQRSGQAGRRHACRSLAGRLPWGHQPS